MANIYLTYLWKLDTVFHNQDDWLTYEKMYNISRQSVLSNVLGIDDHILITDTRKNCSYLTMFKEVTRYTYQLWKQGNNILSCDVDVICVKPTRIFSRLDNEHFRMFWPSQAPSHPDVKFNQIPIEYNAGVKYFPAGMPEVLWDYCFHLIEKEARADHWATDQKISNLMMYRQDIVARDPTAFFDNALNWSPYLRNEIPEEDAHIIHLHGSRSSKIALEIMQKYAQHMWG